MLKNLNQEEEEIKSSLLPCQKTQHQSINEKHDKITNKENSDHGQLKKTITIKQKRLENNTTATRQTFALYSKVHCACLAKFHTLFLAFHLYEMAIAHPSLKGVPNTYKSLCCMFLAMKYQEIYPVQLSDLAKYMKISYKLDEYRRYEKDILIAFDINLDIPTLDRMMETYFNEYNFNKVEEMTSYYYLELFITSNRCYKQFGESEACKVIAKLIKRQSLDSAWLFQEPNAQKLIALHILEARSSDKGLEGQITRKYRSEKYDSVSALCF